MILSTALETDCSNKLQKAQQTARWLVWISLYFEYISVTNIHDTVFVFHVCSHTYQASRSF